MASRVLRLLAPVAALALAVVAALALYGFTDPLATGRLPNGGLGDPAQEVWFLEWIAHAIRHLLDPLNTTLLDYPSGINVANNAPVPALGVLAAPVTAALGPVAAYNGLLRLAPVANAFAMATVLRSRLQHPSAVLAAAALFGFGPFVLAQANGDGHLDLEFLALVPVICSLLGRLARGSRRWRDGAWLGAALGVQACISEEVLVELLLVLLVAGIFVAAGRRRLLRSVSSFVRPAIAAAAVVALLAGWLVYGVIAGPGHLDGPAQRASLLQLYRADLLGPLLPTSLQLLAPDAVARHAATFVGGNISENGSYLGVALIGLVVVLGWSARGRREVRMALLCAAVAYVLSLGERLNVDGRSTGFPLPEAVLAHVPLLDNAVPARFGAEVLLFVAFALGFELDGALTSLATLDGRRRRLGFGSLGLGLIVAGATLLPRVPLNSVPVAWPSTLISSLRSIPNGAAVLTFPLAKAPYSEAMIWQADDRLRFSLVGGYATVRGPTGLGQLAPLLLSPPYPEELFVESQEGGAFYYPAAAPPTAASSVELCSMLHDNRIQAVVFSFTGTDPTVVEDYLLDSLGAPNSSTNGVLVWDDAAAVCR